MLKPKILCYFYPRAPKKKYIDIWTWICEEINFWNSLLCLCFSCDLHWRAESSPETQLLSLSFERIEACYTNRWAPRLVSWLSCPQSTLKSLQFCHGSHFNLFPALCRNIQIFGGFEWYFVIKIVYYILQLLPIKSWKKSNILKRSFHK